MPLFLQVQKIRLLLRQRGLGAIRVGTVDDYQGQEERIIFISTVLSRPESLPPLASAAAAAPGAAAQTPGSEVGAAGGSAGGRAAPTAAAAADVHLGFWWVRLFASWRAAVSPRKPYAPHVGLVLRGLIPHVQRQSLQHHGCHYAVRCISPNCSAHVLAFEMPSAGATPSASPWL
jgi:hypothetical protein